MKYKKTILVAAVLACCSLPITAFAQDQGGFNPPPGGQNGAGQNGGGFGGQNGGRFGGQNGGNRGNRRAPFAFGKVTAVDTTANTITIAGNNGQSQTISLGTGAQVVTEASVTIADLKVGDQIEVDGVPTGITAANITDGQPPAGLPGAGGGFGGGRGGFGGPGGGNPPAANGAAGQDASGSGNARASGTIETLPTAKDPHIGLSLDADTELFIKVASDAKIMKFSTENVGDVKVGDQIMASGTTGDDGTFTATSVGVNLPQPNGGGGFGGGFGGYRGGNQGNRRGGGQGGFGGGQGGFGGPGGGGQAGFGGGGQGGFGGPGGGGDQDAPPPAPGQ